MQSVTDTSQTDSNDIEEILHAVSEQDRIPGQNALPEEQLRILVVDDNPAIHDDFRKVLVAEHSDIDLADAEAAFFGTESLPQDQLLNVDLHKALQGEDGYRMVAAAVKDNRPYTMAFVDMRMPPGWDGLTTIEKLWEVDPDLQVVICSAYSDNTWVDISRRLGRTDRLLILKKPFDNSEVSQLVLTLGEKQRLARQARARMGELESIVQKRTHALQESHKESERLLTAISSLMIGLDADGLVHRWNARAEQVFGIATADAIGRPFMNLPIPWTQPDQIRSMVSAARVAPLERIELEISTPTSATRILGASIYRVLNDGQFAGSVLLASEITEHRKLETQLHSALKLEAVGQLAAGVAHEINTPMQYIGDNIDYVQKALAEVATAVEGCLTLMEDESTPSADLLKRLHECTDATRLRRLLADLPEAISDTRAGVENVSQIVHAMKAFSHPGSDAMTDVDLNDAIATTLTVARNEWKYVAEVETDFEPNLPLVNAFAGELNQALLNIIVNAAHAIGDHRSPDSDALGTIRITTSLLDGEVEVRISDTGGGIPEPIHNRIFDPFFTTKDIGRGTGQGLCMAHAVIVKNHKGRLWFETQQGTGTTFIIRLATVESED